MHTADAFRVTRAGFIASLLAALLTACVGSAQPRDVATDAPQEHADEDAARDALVPPDAEDAAIADSDAPTCHLTGLAAPSALVLPSTDPVEVERSGPGPALQSQSDWVSIASAGGRYLAVWRDCEASWSTDSYCDLRFARFDADGAMLDPAPTVLARDAYSPVVASDGTDFFAVWNQFTAATPSRQDVYGTRISAQGGVYDPGGRPLIDGPGDESSAAVVWTGGEYLVASSRSETGAVLARRIARDGQPLDASPTVVTRNAGWMVSAAGGAGEALVVWSPGAGTAGFRGAARVRGGSVLDPAGIVLGAAPWYDGPVRATWTGDSWWVDWGARTGTSGACDVAVSAVRIDRAGVASPVQRVDAPSRPGCEVETSLAWVGSSVVHAYASASGFVLCSHTESGVELGCHDVPVPQSIHGWQGVSAFAPAAGGGGLFAYSRMDRLGETHWDYLMARIDSTGAPVSAARRPLPSAVGASQRWAAVAAGPGGHMVVYCDSGGSEATWNVRAAPVDLAGHVGAARVLAEGSGPECWPAVTRHGDGFLVAWVNRSNHVLAMRVDGAARPLDAAPQALGSALAGDRVLDTTYIPAPQLAIAWNGTLSLVVWNTASSTGPGVTAGQLRAVRVERDGRILDAAPIAITGTAMSESNSPLAVAGSAERFAVVYPAGRAGGYGNSYPIMGIAVVEADGAVSYQASLGVGQSGSVLVDGDGFLVGFGGYEGYQLVRTDPRGHVCSASRELASGAVEALLVRHRVGPVLFRSSSAVNGARSWDDAPISESGGGASGEATRGSPVTRLVADGYGGRVVFAYEAPDTARGHRVLVRTLP